MDRSQIALYAALACFVVAIIVIFVMLSQFKTSVDGFGKDLGTLKTSVAAITKSMQTTGTGNVVLSTTDSSAAFTPTIGALLPSDTATLKAASVRLFAAQTMKEYVITYTYRTTSTSPVFVSTSIDLGTASGFDSSKMVNWSCAGFIPKRSTDTQTGNEPVNVIDVNTAGISSSTAINCKFLTNYAGTYTITARLLCSN